MYWAKGAQGLLATLEPSQPLAPQLSKAFARKESPIWADSSTGAQCASVEAKVGRERLAKAPTRVSGS